MERILKAFATLIRVLTFGRLKYSRQVEGNARYMGLGEKLWWGYKFFGNPIREPQKNKGIREHFEKNSPDGFWNAKARSDGTGGLPSVSLPPSELPSAGLPSTGFPSLTIGFAGDILPCSPFPTTPSPHLSMVIDFFTKADINCANLESPVLATRPLCIPPEDITAPPLMNNSPEALTYLLQATGSAPATRSASEPGITVFSTANNHSLDQGVEGVLATLDLLDEMGVKHVGTARSSAERDELLLLDVADFRIAFLSWTFSLNSQCLPDGQEYLANTLRLNLPGVDISTIASQVQEARQRGADAVVLFLHWGLEDEAFPLASQIETAHRLARCGVDIICGNHPHALQPAERYVWFEENRSGACDGTCDDGCSEGNVKPRDDVSDNSLLHECLIMYALGDFLTPQPWLGMSARSATMEVTLIRLPDNRVVIYNTLWEEHLNSDHTSPQP
ncbi:MAG: CapA family protein [Coriobacteriia bacterium]|nr:CapA family protein [Coriobacteriia bacterium]